METTDRLSPETLAKLLQPLDAASSTSPSTFDFNKDTEPNPENLAQPEEEDFTVA
ncbi:hypothetical protein NW820_05135 [Synechococcus sp. R55.7]